MVESASINKSLFVLAQCVEAISKKQSRIPYRESKMTRILSLGQNNGLTVMILNLAPVKSYHLDTLSSLNFANRTKKIEVNEIENEPIFKGPSVKITSAIGGALNRQPLRQLTSTQNVQPDMNKRKEKSIVKTFPVFSDKSWNSTSIKRPLYTSNAGNNRPSKIARSTEAPNAGMSKEDIEEMIEKRLNQKLAERALEEKVTSAPALPNDLQLRLDALEKRVNKKEDSEGLQYLLMAKQHQARGEDSSAMRMYQLAQPFYPNNEKLARKMASLQAKIQSKSDDFYPDQASSQKTSRRKQSSNCDYDYEYNAADNHEAEESFQYMKPKSKKEKIKAPIYHDGPATPRTHQLLEIINSRDISQIKLLKGIGAKKAEAIVNSLFDMEAGEDGSLVTDLEQLGALRGVGWKSVENMRVGLGAVAF